MAVKVNRKEPGSVTGGELLDRVLKKGKYGELKAAQIMKQLLEGVAYLHSIGVVHRDLKVGCSSSTMAE
jgi:serine/threonine protein kinase